MWTVRSWIISGEVGWGIYSGGCLARAERTWRTGAGGRGERCVHRVDGWTDGPGGKGADGRADKGKGRGQLSGWADGAHEAQTGGRANEARTGGLGGWGRKSRGRADWADGRTSSLVVGRTGGRADEWTGGRAGGPGFKRPHSTRPTSLLSAQSACLIRTRVRRVPRSVVGSNRIPRQTPVLSARTYFPRFSASVLGAEKDILLLAIRK